TISPAKTVSGAVGGWVAGMIAGTVFWMVFAKNGDVASPWWIGLLLAAAMGIVGQAGDLTESAVKRLFRIKDSGEIIPGHGGFMDRLAGAPFGPRLLCAIGAIHGGIGAVAQGFLYW